MLGSTTEGFGEAFEHLLMCPLNRNNQRRVPFDEEQLAPSTSLHFGNGEERAGQETACLEGRFMHLLRKEAAGNSNGKEQ